MKHKLVRLILVVAVIMSLVTVGCAQSPSAPIPPPFDEDKGYPSEPVPGEATGGSVSELRDDKIERKIIKTGYITLEVVDVVQAMDEVAEVADTLGGYVVSSHKSEGAKRISGSVTIRVLADRFDEAFDRLRQLAVDVPYESTEARDVTEEYVDLQAQLHNLEATEAQFLALLEKAETVEEILQVQKALSNVRGQIERIEGQIKYLERTSDMALIEVRLRETEKLVEPWSGFDTIKSAVRGLTALGRGLATAVIWLGIFCWIWIPILVFWLKRRRRAKG